MKKLSDIKELLDTDLDKSLVKKHPSTGFDYLEGYVVINTANEIFGFDGWDSRVYFEFMKEYSLPASQKGTARGLISVPVDVTVNIENEKGEVDTITHGDVGTCVWNGQDQIETAMKGAVTDGIKRALRYFGKRFGNDLYKGDDVVTTGGYSKPYSRPTTSASSVEQPSNAPTCDLCGSKMVLRNGRFGDFWGCSSYPECKRLVNPSEVDENGKITKPKEAPKSTAKPAKSEGVQIEEVVNIEEIAADIPF